jgi:phage-related protein
MAQYDAGSIEATLKVNEDPFDAGLRHAQERVRQFEGEDHSTSLDLHVDDARAQEEITRLQARLAELSDDGGFSIKANIDVDDAQAKEEIDQIRARIAELRDKDVTIRVNTKESTDSVHRLGNELDRTIGSSGGGGSGGGSGGHGLLGFLSKAALFGTAGSLIAGSLNPLIGTALGLGGAFTLAGVPLLGFGKLASSQFKTMTEDTKAVTKAQLELTNATTDKAREKAIVDLAAANAKLVGPEREAAKAMLGLQSATAKFKQDTSKETFGVLTDGANMLSGVLPKLVPLMNATGAAVRGSIGQIGTALNSGGFAHFLSFLSKEIGPVLHSLTGSFINLFSGIASALENSMPVINEFLKMFGDLTKGFSDMTKSAGFKDFMKSLADDMKLLEPVLKDVFGLLGDLLTGIEPLVAPVMHVLDALIGAVRILIPPLVIFFKAIADGLVILADSGVLDQFATLLGKILIALAPLIPPLMEIIVAALPPLIDLISALLPIIGPLVPILSMVAKVVGFVGDAFSTVIDALGPALPIIVGIVGGFMLLGPVLAALTGPIGLVVLAITAVVVIASEIIKHWSSIASFFSKLWHDIAGFFTDNWRTILDVVFPFIGLPLEIIHHWDAVVTFFENLWHTIVGFVVNLYNDVANWFTNLAATVGAWVGNLVETVVNWFTSLAARVGSAVGNMVSRVVGFFTSLASRAGSAISGLVSRVVGFFGSMASRVGSAVSSLVSRVVGWFSSMASRAVSSVSSLISRVIGWFAGLPGRVLSAMGDLASIGASILQGIWDGIDGAADWLLDKMKGWASDLWHSILGFFHIGSPSKLARDELGLPIVQGAALGMIGNKHLMVNAMKDIGRELMNTKIDSPEINYRLTGVSTMAREQAAAHTAAVADLNAQIDKLRGDVKNLPAATGDAVTDGLAPKLEKQTRDTHQLALVSKRQGG